MGGGFSNLKSDEVEVSRKISRSLLAEKKAVGTMPSVLLLGTGSGGKSTLFKQMKLKYTKEGFGNCLDFKPVVSLNIIRGLRRAYDLESERNGAESNLQDKTRAAYDGLHAHQGLDLWGKITFEGKTRQIHELCALIWEDPVIKSTFETSRSFIEEPLDYFMGRMEIISSNSYLPSAQDILYLRQRTSGARSMVVQFEGSQLRLIDVGGQKSERRKWANHFEGVTALIFVVSLGDFDCVLLEDGSTNRLLDSIAAFEDVVANEFFHRLNVILILNKKDLFWKKIVNEKISLSQFFPEYPGKVGDYREAVNFIRYKFQFVFDTAKSTIPSSSRPLLQVFNTVGTDTENVQKVFKSCKTILFMQSLS